MKRILLITPLLAAAFAAPAQRPANALTVEDYFAASLDDILATVDNDVDGTEKACHCALADLDHDGANELVVADVNKLKCVFKVVDGDVNLISPDYVINDDSLAWIPINDFYYLEGIDRSHDITVSCYPMFAYDTRIASNRFTVPGDVAWPSNVMAATRYDRMVFKPHVGTLSFVEAAPGSYDSDGQTIDLGICYTYTLDDQAMTRKMFRGYNDGQAVPIVVPQRWLDTHTPLQYSRWLEGEPEPNVSADTRQIIGQHYAGMPIVAVSWLASCPVNERNFYWVVLGPTAGRVLTAMVCIAEGEVVSARHMWFEQSSYDPDAIDFGPDIVDLVSLSPDIMVMAATPAGLELYVRWSSFEGVHFDIWREVADQFISIQTDYHYIMAY